MLPILGSLMPVIGTVLDRVITDEAGKEKAKLEMQAAAPWQVSKLPPP